MTFGHHHFPLPLRRFLKKIVARIPKVIVNRLRKRVVIAYPAQRSGFNSPGPAVVTAICWNVELLDDEAVYAVNRSKRLFGASAAKRLNAVRFPNDCINVCHFISYAILAKRQKTRQF
jgi:hypothetical protein